MYAWLSGFVEFALRCALFFILVLLIVGAPSAVVWCFRAAFRAVAVSASACAVLVTSASASAVLVAAVTASAVLVDRAVCSAVRTIPGVTILAEA